MRTSDGESLAATEATTHDEVWRGARLARWGCALLATLVIGLDIAGIPATYAQQSVVAAPGATIYAGALTPAQAHMLTTLGLSLGQYAAIQVAEAALLELVFFVVALTLLWRKPASRMALFAACALVLFGASFGQATGGGMMGALAVRSDAWKFIVTLIGFLGDVTFPVLFYLFPSGPLGTALVALARVPLDCRRGLSGFRAQQPTGPAVVAWQCALHWPGQHDDCFADLSLSPRLHADRAAADEMGRLRVCHRHRRLSHHHHHRRHSRN